MKKYYIILIAFLGCLGLQAKDMTGLKIYINPGHGGYDSDDRNVAVYPYAQGDTLGFWESSSNLHKGLMLRELLQEQGATVAMSRVLNRTEDDRGQGSGKDTVQAPYRKPSNLLDSNGRVCRGRF